MGQKVLEAVPALLDVPSRLICCLKTLAHPLVFGTIVDPVPANRGCGGLPPSCGVDPWTGWFPQLFVAAGSIAIYLRFQALMNHYRFQCICSPSRISLQV